MTRDSSPEERLLKLIKGVHKRDEPPETQPQRTENREQRTDAEAQKEIPRGEKPEPKISTAPVKESPFKKKLDPFKVAVFLLIGFFILGIFYFTYELFGQRRQPPVIDIEKLIAPDVEQPPAAAEKPKEPPEEEQIPPQEEEEFPPETRELFGAPATREAPVLVEEGPSISELAKDLVLVGVITGDNPQAIIQDKKTRQTFYVCEGESVSEFTVKKIEKATVVLERNEETIKLSL